LIPRAGVAVAATVLVIASACTGVAPPATPAATPTSSARASASAVPTVTATSATAAPGVELAGTAWTVIALDTGPVPPDAGVELAFSATDVQGSSGCNSFSGPYVRTAADIVFESVVSTRRACSSPIVDRERALYQALPLIRSMRPSGAELLLLDAAGATRIHLRQGVGIGG
jgi:heat shock protein HslJ